jgi:UDP-2,3-diacylglucosamine pyrophosphatase LpxH
VLIFLSDMHLMDGTAGVHHLGANAFRGTFQDLAAHAEKAGARDVTVVFLGDIYELVRTQRWFGFPLDQRPWGRQPSELAANDIFDGVVANNRETFQILAGSLQDQFGFPVEPRRVYVPGNHDRLCNLYPSLRRKVRATLGLPASDEPFPHSFLDSEHRVYARHGQEWDLFNFEGSETFSLLHHVEIPLADYLRTPIGDLVAAEFISKVPILALEELPEQEADRALIVDRLRHLFDVRPMVGIVQWLSYQLTRYDDRLRGIVNGAVRRAAAEFSEIPFVQEWIAAHDRWANPFDEADRLKLLLALMESWRVLDSRQMLRLLEMGIGADEGEHYAARASEDFRRLDADPASRGEILCVLYGHTHGALQRGIDVIGDPPRELYRVYANTGTWRPVHRQSHSKRGFVVSKSLTYSIVYKPGEKILDRRIAQVPALETWSGGFIEEA